MVMLMARPMKRDGSPNQYYCKRVPADLLDQLRGQSLTVHLPLTTAFASDIVPVKSTIGDVIKFSLRTSDRALARTRYAAALAQVERYLEAARAGPADLSFKAIIALAGLAREQLVKEHDANPPSEMELDLWGDFITDAVMADGRPLSSCGVKVQMRAVEKLKSIFDVNAFLTANAVILNGKSFGDFLDALVDTLADVVRLLKRRTDGDYSADLNAAMYPAFSPDRRQTLAPKTAESLTGLVDLWWIEAKATGKSASTYESYRNTFRTFSTFLGHDDPARITPSDVVGFKDHRLSAINPKTQRPVSAKTVKASDLTALKSVFDWAVSNLKLASNPAKDVTVKLGKRLKVRDRDFTDKEAALILSLSSAALSGKKRPNQTDLAKRWVPWLCAYTGARVGEMVQLRKEDIKQIGASWLISVTPEAGTVKGKERRDIPLHSHLVDMGFLEFVQSSDNGYLFMTIKPDSTFEGVWQSKKNRLAEFARTVVKDPNVAPNHAWRHTFKSKAIEVNIQEKVLDAICGHAPTSVGRSYGSVTLQTKVDAIAAFPRYVIDQDAVHPEKVETAA
jgi:integrase